MAGLLLIGNLDFSELMIVLLAAILIFGKNLPKVAGQAGAQLGRLRRSLDTLWNETGMEKEIRDVRREIQNAIPRDLSLGEMAQMASNEMDRRIKANEAADRARATPAALPPPSDPARDAPDESTAPANGAVEVSEQERH